MRVFMSTGEPSGDFLAAELGKAMRALEPGIELSGIGGERMAAAGFHLTKRTTGWASLGPVEALTRIPPLLYSALRHLFWLAAQRFDLIVMVDFGAFNLRIAKWLRVLGYRGPILYFVPPGAWFDKAAQAREVARLTTPLTPFAHQRDFYRSLGLPVAWFGHPLVSLVRPRSARPPAPEGGGTVGLLPGSREAEVRRHMGPLLGACRLLRRQRPHLALVIAAAHAEAERWIATALANEGASGEVTIVRGARATLEAADAAFVASGTALLEAALLEVPSVGLYILGQAQVGYARRVLGRLPFVTLPNLLLGREAIPEILQDDATPENLAAALEPLLRDPSAQFATSRELRAALGPPDALARCAEFAVGLARTA
jgi:lipid-A-disaccharide synthase